MVIPGMTASAVGGGGPSSGTPTGPSSSSSMQGPQSQLNKKEVAHLMATEADMKVNIDKDHYEAIKFYGMAIQLDPTEARFFLNRSYCYSQLELYQLALGDAEQAIRIDPKSTKGYFRRGQALVGLKKFIDAEKSFQEVLKLDPDCQESTVNKELVNVRLLSLQSLGFETEKARMTALTHSSIEEAVSFLLSGKLQNGLASNLNNDQPSAKGSSSSSSSSSSSCSLWTDRSSSQSQSSTPSSQPTHSIWDQQIKQSPSPPESASSSLLSMTNGIQRNGNNNCQRPFSSTSSSITEAVTNMTNMYEKWSIAGSGSPDSGLFSNGSSTHPLLDQLNNYETRLDLTSPSLSKLLNGSASCGPGLLPLKSQIKRQKMIYHCKFGEFGVMEGQFTEPSGVAVNAQNDIIVADTNNHRIQIFDKEGRFKFQFGECGKRDGQLLYPNRVAVVKNSGDIIVTERSPTHQIQIYNQYGQFVRKFGANILQHPRGVTVDNKGRIIVVECKVMRVLIFDQNGNVLHKFGCSKHLEFPNGVVVNDRQEIFISDNRAHCVKVFSYEGIFLRQIGGEGLTNYPIGVCINEAGEILVADNHNNFNITIFTQDGQLISALESKVKHAQCFDVALMDDNSVVLASKDYRIYIYRYLQLQSLAQAVAASPLC